MASRTLVEVWQAETLSRRAFLERAAALGVSQRNEDYGLQKYVECRALELRNFNFRMRRA